MAFIEKSKIKEFVDSQNWNPFILKLVNSQVDMSPFKFDRAPDIVYDEEFGQPELETIPLWEDRDQYTTICYQHFNGKGRFIKILTEIGVDDPYIIAETDRGLMINLYLRYVREFLDWHDDESCNKSTELAKDLGKEILPKDYELLLKKVFDGEIDSIDEYTRDL